MTETMADIARRVAAKHGLPGASALRAQIRTRKYSAARYEAWAEIYRTGRFSYPQIGRAFNRSHTTILLGVRRYNGRGAA